MNKLEWQKVRAVWRDLGIDRSATHYWQKRDKIPADRVAEVSKLTGIPRARLRPDLYGA